MVVKQQLSKTKGPFKCERNGGMDAQHPSMAQRQEVLCIRLDLKTPRLQKGLVDPTTSEE